MSGRDVNYLEATNKEERMETEEKPKYNEELKLPERGETKLNLRHAKKIDVRSNSHKVTFTDMIFYRYEVKFWAQTSVKTKDLTEKVKLAANAESRRLLLGHLFEKLREQNSQIFEKGKKFIFDNSRTVISSNELDVPNEPIDIDQSSLDAKHRDNLAKRLERLYATFQYVGEIQLDSASIKHADELNDRDRSPIQVLELIFNQHILTSDKFYVSEQTCYLKDPGRQQNAKIQGRVMMDGLSKGIRLGGDSSKDPELVMQIDVKKGPFFPEGTLGDYLKEWYGASRTDDLKDKLRKIVESERDRDQEREFQKLSKELKGLTLITNHLKKNKIFRCTGISKKTAREIMFQVDDKKKDDDTEGPDAKRSKREISVYEYYKQRYKNMDFRFSNYPCIVETTFIRGTKDKVANFYMLDVLNIVGGQRVSLQKMERDFQEKMIKESAMSAAKLIETTERLAKNAYLTSSNPTAKEFGCRLESEPIKVQADVLHPPALKFKGSKAEYDANCRVNLPRDHQYVIPAECKSWIAVNYQNCVDPRKVDGFIRNIESFLKSHGVRIPQANVLNARSEKEIYEYAEKKRPDMVMFFTSKSGGDYLHRIMKHWELSSGVVTQHINEGTLLKSSDRPQANTLNNVVMKMNEKMGGLNFTVTDGDAFVSANKQIARGRLLVDEWLGNGRMFIGVDLANRSNGESKTVVGITYNYDEKHNTAGKVAYIGPKASVIYDLDQFLLGPIFDYKERSKSRRWPTHLFIYRGGVSEGDYVSVLASEKRAIRKLLKNLCDEHKAPSIGYTFIIAQRDHKHRVVPAEAVSSSSGNGGRDDRGSRDDRDSYRGGRDDRGYGRDDRGFEGGFRGGRGGFGGGRGGFGNAGPKLPIGTSITTSLVDPTKEQWLALSHTAFQGLAKPIIYTVVADQGANKERQDRDELIYMTHALHFNHGSITTPVSRASYLYWAGEVAKRGTANLVVEEERNPEIASLSPEELTKRLKVTLKGKFFS